MGKRDARVDAYIAKSADFAKPILTHLRGVVHEGCPEVEEAIKWGTPHFVYKGMLAQMAAFKAHCAFGFWKGSAMEVTPGGSAEKVGETAMGQFGRITRLADLPAKRTLIGYVKRAAALNDRGVKAPMRKPAGPKAPADVPDDLRIALGKNKKAKTTFDAFSPTNKRDYIEWLTEAKTDATRQRRLETAVQWMSEGKDRNWKYR